jgi:hypothetical protein
VEDEDVFIDLAIELSETGDERYIETDQPE